ncbi:PaREP1 family protein [Acidianus sp. HS-5]|uniref:PaREP1 family protein n=1 Tax=Acidianus sp. HS-5 TaxID=2886040 RepID=UPI001F39B109|nr:PaREP1 family protein [Acidianus sp. HS-5]BDC17598.1 superfamily I DNA and RNA helicase and helicaseubunit [Acidianus sp. HS-5]
MEELIRKAEEKGIDVEDVLIQLIYKDDPDGEVKFRLEMAKKYMAEAEDYVKKGDPVQASEKAYKVAEELVKALAEKFNLPEYQKARNEGRWYTYLLGSAAGKLSSNLGTWVMNGWDTAYALHVWGLHEAKWSIQDILPRINTIRKMLEEGEKVLQ